MLTWQEKVLPLVLIKEERDRTGGVVQGSGTDERRFLRKEPQTKLCGTPPENEFSQGERRTLVSRLQLQRRPCLSIQGSLCAGRALIK